MFSHASAFYHLNIILRVGKNLLEVTEFLNIFGLQLLVLNLNNLQVIFIGLSLLSEFLGKVVSLLRVHVNCLDLLILSSHLKLLQASLQSFLLLKELFSFTCEVIFASLNLVLVAEEIFRDLVALLLLYFQSIFKDLSAFL